MAKLVSKVYGDALLEAAQEKGTLDAVYEEVCALCGIFTVVDKARQTEIPAIFRYFIARVKEMKGVGIAQVSTAVELSEAQKAQVESRLLETTAYKSFEMSYRVDPSLIGGMVIRIGDRVVDSSIKNRLNDLRKQLLEVQL